MRSEKEVRDAVKGLEAATFEQASPVRKLVEIAALKWVLEETA